ncbi:MAG TPA: DMT family transporter [Xanthobacteraceae bacterium]|jgi:drug/metabolite transporter (DMT)-like permease|nr:DMT family transporter [Xanthobacteraceae bacterium]
MNFRLAISIKLISVLLFAMMSVLVRYVGETVPLGQVVFFRSAFAIIPVMVIYAWRGELGAAFRTGRPLGHITRGLIAVVSMFLNFAALARLPLVDATAISFAAPFITVALAALVLKERVRVYRWSAVMIGFVGVLVMLWPYLNVGALVTTGSTANTVGAACAITAAFTNAGATIQTRRLTDSETTASIVFYFSLICTLAGLVSLPFAWHAPSAPELTALIAIGVIGGLSHIFLTESYRYAPASVVAPFDYMALLWAFFFGYVLFGEIPSRYVYAGAAIVAGSGLFVIWRERQLGLERARKIQSG